MHAPVVTTGRDLRLDLFRGIALWLIFLDHIPSNIVNWVTIRNYGFSDAAEIFVFISGYTAAFVYGRAMDQRGLIVAPPFIITEAEREICFNSIEALILQTIGADLIGQPDAAAFLTQIEHNAFFHFADFL